VVPLFPRHILEIFTNAVFFNQGSAELQGSACGCQGNRAKLPGTKFANTVLCGLNNIDAWIIA